MYDFTIQGLRAASSGSLYAFPLVFAAGSISSVGPCVAPRFIAIAGLTANQSRRGARILACSFVAGLALTYAAFGVTASLVGRLTDFSTFVYAVVALAFACAGCAALWKDDPAMHEHSRPRPAQYSAGGAFLLGSSFALVISPCCTPVVVGILAYTTGAASPLYGGALLACFALGHALPVFAVGAGARAFAAVLERYAVREAARVFSCGLMCAFAMYYAVLA
jgi:cytochrome c-type biogenesis protein